MTSNGRPRWLASSAALALVVVAFGVYGLVDDTSRVPARAPGAGVTGLAPQLQESGLGGLQWGVTAAIKGWGSQMGRILDGVRTLGVRMIREEIDWSQVEPTPGQWHWATTDKLFLAAARRGLTILPLLMRLPAWAGSDELEIPEDPTGYAEFVSHVVARYGPAGSFWLAHPRFVAEAPSWFELWNEPYYAASADNDVDAGRYARLVAAAGAAGHATDPDAKFLIEAVDQWDDQGNWTSWVDSMYQAVPDLNEYFEGVAVHPYGPSFTDPDETNGFYQDLHDVHEQLVEHGAGEKPFWITEVGYPTCARGAPGECYSEAEQAQKIDTLSWLLRTTYASYVRHVILYDFSDYAEPDDEPTNIQSHFGLIQLNGAAKPAYVSVQDAIVASGGL